METYVTDLSSRRVRLAVALFAALLIWPPIHMWATLRYDISPWRLFGWGMYSTPHKTRFAALRIVFSADLSAEELARVTRPAEPSEEEAAGFIGPLPAKESDPIETFVLVGERTFRVPIDGRILLRTKEQKLDYNRVMEFSSTAAIERFITAVKSFVPVKLPDDVFAVVTRQRLSLSDRKLYTTNKIYHMQGNSWHHLGTTPLYKKTLGELLFEMKRVVSDPGG